MNQELWQQKMKKETGLYIVKRLEITITTKKKKETDRNQKD